MHCLNNFRMTIAQWVGSPAILEIDIAFVLKIPDKVSLSSPNNELQRYFKAFSLRRCASES